MPHTKEKHMINTNRAVLVQFETNANPHQLTSSGSADIYVPFKVKLILRGLIWTLISISNPCILLPI